jgi:hypothetical protein
MIILWSLLPLPLQVAASMATTLGSLGAQQAKVEALLRHGWQPRIIATLGGAISAAARELKRAEAERVAERAALLPKPAPALPPRARMDDVDDFEPPELLRDAAVAAVGAVGAAHGSTVPELEYWTLQESRPPPSPSSSSSSSGPWRPRQWRVAVGGAHEHWSLAELRAVVEAGRVEGPCGLGGSSVEGREEEEQQVVQAVEMVRGDWAFCSPAAHSLLISAEQEPTVPLSTMPAGPIMIRLGLAEDESGSSGGGGEAPHSAAAAVEDSESLAEFVAGRLAAAVALLHRPAPVGPPPCPAWQRARIRGRSHPSVEGHSVTLDERDGGALWVWGGITKEQGRDGLRTVQTFTAALCTLRTARGRPLVLLSSEEEEEEEEEGVDEDEEEWEWGWPKVEGTPPEPRSGHSATYVSADNCILYFGGTAPGPNSTMACT